MSSTAHAALRTWRERDGRTMRSTTWAGIARLVVAAFIAIVAFPTELMPEFAPLLGCLAVALLLVFGGSPRPAYERDRG